MSMKDQSRIIETLAIIDALAEGVNPMTGEILPNHSPYNEPRVIRALFTVGSILRQQQGLSDSTRLSPTRAGKPWDAKEDEELTEEYKARLTFEAMVEKHQRTKGAIQSRLVRLGLIEQQTFYESVDVIKPAPKQWWKEQGRTQAGKPWTKDEDDALLRDFQSGMPLEMLAERLKRGINAVEVRLVKLGIKQSML